MYKSFAFFQIFHLQNLHIPQQNLDQIVLQKNNKKSRRSSTLISLAPAMVASPPPLATSPEEKTPERNLHQHRQKIGKSA